MKSEPALQNDQDRMTPVIGLGIPFKVEILKFEYRNTNTPRKRIINIIETSLNHQNARQCTTKEIVTVNTILSYNYFKCINDYYQ
jgi:hypothetical protein